jgi:rhomboid protease GluP
MIAALILILVLSGVFALPYVIDFGEGSESSHMAFVSNWWKDNEDIRSGEWYRLLTANFLHADTLHLLSNLYGLYIFGSNLPPALMISLFLLGGIVGTSFSFFFNPSPSLGASSGVFAMVGFILALSLGEGIGTGVDTLILYVVISFVYASVPGSRIDIFGHLGGLVAGVVVGLLLSI